jgi:signal transduction histidine kinase
VTGTTEKKEVRCLGLTLMLSYLEGKGIDARTVLAGLPYDEDYLRTTSNWIDRQTFFEVEGRVRKLFPDEKDLFYQIGLQTSQTKSFGFFRLMANLSGSPLAIYRIYEKLISKHLFRFVSVRIVEKWENRAVLEYTFDGPLEQYANFIETARGILSATPELVGFGRADVRCAIDQGRVYYTVTYPRRAGLFRRMWRYLFVRSSVLPETYQELENAHNELLMKMNELESAHEALKKNAARVEALNELKAMLVPNIEVNALIESFSRHMAGRFDIGRILVILSQKDESKASSVCYCKGFFNRDEERYYTLDYVSDIEGVASFLRSGKEGRHRMGPGRVERLMAGDVVYRHVFEGHACILAYPLEWSGDPLGYVLFGAGDGSRISDEEERFFGGVCDIFAVYLVNAMTYSRLEQLNVSLNRQVEDKTRELKSLNEALTRELEEKERFEKLRKDFITYVGHELNTPLQCILPPLEIILMRAGELKDEGLIDDLRTMKANAQRLKTLVHRLLDYVRLEADGFMAEPYHVDVESLLSESARDFILLAKGREVKFEYDALDRPCFVHGNAELLRAAVGNIAENAIKYSLPGTLVKMAAGFDGRELSVSVSDEGPGISDGDMPSIFQPFLRGKGAGGVSMGWGIGLPMARTVIQKMGGRIDVQSEKGRGSCFTIRLPAVGEEAIGRRPEPGLAVPREHEEEEALPHVPRPVPVPLSEEKLYSLLGDLAPGRYAILVVDDDQGYLEHLRSKLRPVFSVTTVRNGAQALKSLETAVPDLIVSDIMMRPIDGLSLCELVRGNPKLASIPIILVTAMEGTDSTIQGFLRGANDYLKKPFSMDELFVRIRLQLKLVEASRKMILGEKIASLGMLMAGIAHDIKNPLNAIMNSVHPLADSLDRIGRRAGASGDGKEMEDMRLLLSVIRSSTERILDVIQGIQKFVSAPDVESVEVKLEDVFDTSLKILDYKLRDRVRVEKTYGFGGTLRGSPGRLSQVFMNIIDNAVSSMPGGGRIVIKTSTDGENVIVSISDDGQGIPDEVRSRIFDPFFTTKEMGVGTGLGLSICREVVESHRGSIDVNSVPGMGTEFVITLPIDGAGGRRAG